MNRFNTAPALMLTALAMALAACGGSGGTGLVSAPAPAPVPTPTSSPGPSPAPSPAPAPTPTPSPAAALIAPVQTATPAAVLATTGGANFNGPGSGTVFPLLHTTVGPDFGGDAVTTNAGATLKHGAGGFSLTLNNPALDLRDQPETPGVWPWHNRDRVRIFDPAHLNFTTFGYWVVPLNSTAQFRDIAGGVVAGGYMTPSSAIPAAGSATYSGETRGIIGPGNLENGTVMTEFFADVEMRADFAARRVTGSMSDFGYSYELWPFPGLAIGFEANLDGARNLFTGTTSITSPPINTIGWFPNSGTGTIAGSFFGPSAQEAGAIWTIDGDRNLRMIGAFGVKQ